MLSSALLLAASAMSVIIPGQERFLAPQDTFELHFDCGSLAEQPACIAAQESITAAAQLIAQELYFSIPLVVGVGFVADNARNWYTDSRDISPLYTTTTFFAYTGRSVVSNVTYPMSIIKTNVSQAIVSDNALLRRPDMDITFNTARNWVYALNDPIGEDQIDLKCNSI